MDQQGFSRSDSRPPVLAYAYLTAPPPALQRLIGDGFDGGELLVHDLLDFFYVDPQHRVCPADGQHDEDRP